MRTTELALVAAVILGCVFKIQHLPGASMLIVFGGLLLALFYFPFGFRTLPAPKPTDQILWMTLVAGISMSTALFGEVAFLQHWPNNTPLLLTGAIGCAVSMFLCAVLRYRHPRLRIHIDGLLIRCLVLGGLSITIWNLFAGKPH